MYRTAIDLQLLQEQTILEERPYRPNHPVEQIGHGISRRWELPDGRISVADNTFGPLSVLHDEGTGMLRIGWDGLEGVLTKPRELVMTVPLPPLTFTELKEYNAAENTLLTVMVASTPFGNAIVSGSGRRLRVRMGKILTNRDMVTVLTTVYDSSDSNIALLSEEPDIAVRRAVTRWFRNTLRLPMAQQVV